MVRTERWKYVHDPTGDLDELYDLENDPWELVNVIQESTNRQILSDLRLALADWSILTEDMPHSREIGRPVCPRNASSA
jgi:arylsulfatase A-like enzyme